MVTKAKGLSELFPEYPADHPQTLQELFEAEPSTLSNPVAWELRRQSVQMAHSTETHYVNTPWDVLKLITSGYVIRPFEKGWVSHALSATRQPILIPREDGSLRYQKKATKLLPKPDELPNLYRGSGNKRAPAWLVVYGGSPEILEKEPVRKGLAKLTRMRAIADIVFYENLPDALPTLWSIKAGTGMSGVTKNSAKEIPFPEPSYVLEIGKDL